MKWERPSCGGKRADRSLGCTVSCPFQIYDNCRRNHSAALPLPRRTMSSGRSHSWGSHGSSHGPNFTPSFTVSESHYFVQNVCLYNVFGETTFVRRQLYHKTDPQSGRIDNAHPDDFDSDDSEFEEPEDRYAHLGKQSINEMLLKK